MTKLRLSKTLAVAAASTLITASAWAQDADGITGWPSYNRTLASARYAPHDQINTTNVGQLRELCVYDLKIQTEFEPGPIVIGNVLYGTSEMDIFAINAETCQEIWRVHEDIPIPRRHFPTNRGAAYLDGKLFRGTQDARVFAYDAGTGKKLWETKILETQGESVPAAPIVWNGMVFVGNAGGDLKGVKGRMYALDANTGKIVWETYLVPDQGRAKTKVEHDKITAPTWQNKTNVPITGGATWTSYTIDTVTGLLYVPGGNPAPDFNNRVRPGDNLFAGSMVVLDAKTGAYRRHYPLVPRDFHDWDVSAAPALFHNKAGRYMMAIIGKNGLLYGYDLTTHKRMYATPVTTRRNVNAPLSKKGVEFCPGASGGAEWNGPAYSPATGLIYTGEADWCSIVTLEDDDDTIGAEEGQSWTGAIKEALFGDHTKGPWAGWLMATDAETGKVKWKYKAAAPVLSGVTPTKGGVVFAGDMNGNAFAFDSATGKELWKTKFDGAPGGGVVTYMVGDKQRVAMASGTYSFVFPLSPKGNAQIHIFGL